MAKFLERLLGSKSDRDIKSITPIQKQIFEAYETIQNLSNDELRAKTGEFKSRIGDAIAAQQNEIKEIKNQINHNPDMDDDEILR